MDGQIAKAFGSRLKELRQAKDWTLATLAAHTRPPMQAQAIARYESGDRVPGLEVVYRLAAALGVHRCKLLPAAARPRREKR